MNILFIGGAYSDNLKDIFLKHSRRGYSYSAQTFCSALISGMLGNDVNLFCLFRPYLSAFPTGYRRPIVPSREFIYDGRSLGHSFGFINIPFYWGVSVRRYMKYVRGWYDSTEGEKVVLMYNLNPSQMNVAFAIKSRYPEVQISCIVADLPDHTRYNRIFTHFGFKKKVVDYIYSNVRSIDSFIMLSERMREALSVQDKPYMVMEGMYNGGGIEYSFNKDKEKVVLYTGALVAQYGVGDLLDAFSLIEDGDYRLWLCGDGDCVSRIRQMQMRDKRVCFFGVVSPEKVRELQRRATVLVNPRHSGEEFTTYSFPSKTMEYLASGTATLMARLGCLPDEYIPHLELFDDETPEGMKNKIVEVCEKDRAALAKKGKESSEFIVRNKSSVVQVGRIVSFLKQNVPGSIIHI